MPKYFSSRMLSNKTFNISFNNVIFISNNNHYKVNNKKLRSSNRIMFLKILMNPNKLLKLRNNDNLNKIYM